MPLYRVYPGLGLDDLQRRGFAQRVIITLLLVFFQHFFEIVTAVFGGLSVYVICFRIPFHAWYHFHRHLGFVGGDEVELKAHRWNISLAMAIFHGILLINWFGAVMRCRWLAADGLRTGSQRIGNNGSGACVGIYALVDSIRSHPVLRHLPTIEQERDRTLAVHHRRNHAGHWETPQNKIVAQADDPGRDLGVYW